MLERGYCVSAGLNIKATFNLQHYKVNFILQWRWALRFLLHFYVQMLLVLQIAAVSFRHGAQMWMLKHLQACNLNISKPAKCYQYLYWTNFHDCLSTESHNQQSEQPFPPQTPSFVQVFLLSAYNLNTYSYSVKLRPWRQRRSLNVTSCCKNEDLVSMRCLLPSANTHTGFTFLSGSIGLFLAAQWNVVMLNMLQRRFKINHVSNWPDSLLCCFPLAII